MTGKPRYDVRHDDHVWDDQDQCYVATCLDQEAAQALADKLNDAQAVETAARAYFTALDAFNDFEALHPDDSSSRWDKVYSALCDSREALRTTLAIAPWSAP